MLGCGARQRYLKAKDYPEVARRSIQEMHRQVGPLLIGADGLAQRGVLLRHLLMPSCYADTCAILRFVAEEVSRYTYINVMDQYFPAGRVGSQQYAEINRRITLDEHEQALAYAYSLGLTRIDTRRPHGAGPC